MKQSGGNDLLKYNFYTNVSRTTILGNGAAGTAIIELKRPPGKPQPWTQGLTIYGRIPPGQDVSAGSYSDTLTVTVVW
jgi:spore coat protein U-like protein